MNHQEIHTFTEDFFLLHQQIDGSYFHLDLTQNIKGKARFSITVAHLIAYSANMKLVFLSNGLIIQCENSLGIFLKRQES